MNFISLRFFFQLFLKFDVIVDIHRDFIVTLYAQVVDTPNIMTVDNGVTGHDDGQ